MSEEKKYCKISIKMSNSELNIDNIIYSMTIPIAYLEKESSAIDMLLLNINHILSNAALCNIITAPAHYNIRENIRHNLEKAKYNFFTKLKTENILITASSRAIKKERL